MRQQTKTLHRLLEEGALFIPGIYDCLSARVMEANGFQAVYLDPLSLAASYCGVPDVNLMAATDLTNMLSRITAYLSLPVIADLRGGFGNELNVVRNCERVAAAGARAVMLSDDLFLRKPFSDAVSGAEEFGSKLEAAKYALEGADCALIARTNAWKTLGADEAIARCKLAAEHGVDVTCAAGVTDPADIERIGAEVPGWKIHELCGDGVDFDRLAEWDYRMVCAPHVSAAGTMTVVQELADDAWEHKNDFRAEERGYSTMAKFELLRIHEWFDLGKRFNDSIHTAQSIDPDDYLRQREQSAR